MLEELAKKDSYWRSIAFNICKDRMTADDLVQDMYLRLHNVEKPIKDFYVVLTIRNLFIDKIKQEKKTTDLEYLILEDTATKYELCDKEMELIDSLKWWELELIEESYSKSLRQIEKEFNIDHSFTHRIIAKAKSKWQEKNK